MNYGKVYQSAIGKYGSQSVALNLFFINESTSEISDGFVLFKKINEIGETNPSWLKEPIP